ncbi:MAG: hypothetical protein D6731_20635 [Planctomycetota bacterium]|nr:MAG: hypothetical protein D6731_20635 [Planctomycetota bacterium]
MEGFEQERRGLFDGLQTPVNYNAVVVAALAILVYLLGLLAIQSAHSGIPGDPEDPLRLLWGMLGNVTARMGTCGAFLAHWGGWDNAVTEYDLVVWALFLAWTGAVWAFASVTICRIAAVEIALEEVLELREALRFGARKFLSNFLSIVFVLGIVGFFYLFCNATLAGWIGSIPYVGDVLLGVFYFLVLISSLLAVAAASLGALGANLSAATIATESSDAFDGFTRSWNYLVHRSWTVALASFATFAVLCVLLFCGQWFLKVSVRSLSVGFWGLGAGEERLPVDEDVRAALELPKTMKLSEVFVPAKGEYLYKRVIHDEFVPDSKGRIFYRQGIEFALERYKAHTGSYPRRLEDLIRKPENGPESWFGPYLDPTLTEVPRDPWDRELVYEVDPDGYRISSVGPDGQPGTTDDLSLEQLESGWPRHGPLLNVAPILEGGTRGFLTVATWFWVDVVARGLVYAFALAYFFGAQTLLYFFLRKDVEGDDYTEIVLEEDPAFVEPPPPAPPTSSEAAPAKEEEASGPQA